MVIIPVRTVGDLWYNEDEVQNRFFSTSPEETIMLDLCHEGPSLVAIGLIAAVTGWCKSSNRDVASVKINSPNIVEKTVFENICTNQKNHFFQFAKTEYHRDFKPLDASSKLFGCFIGRYTPERQRILLDVSNRYQDSFLLSVMRGNQPWQGTVRNVASLDNYSVKDQYVPNRKTNTSIMSFYDQFEIELVAETFIQGDTFFPTEKTLRPIMGCKPILVFGPKNFLANLRTLGFVSYSELWDEYYDRLEGIERWLAMCDVIEKIISHGYDLISANRIIKWNYAEINQ